MFIAIGISAALAASACSEGSSKEERYRAAVSNVWASIRPATAQWAVNVSSEMRDQLQTAGALDLVSVQGDAGRSGEPVANSACEAVKKNDDVAALDNPTEPARELRMLIAREFMLAIGKQPSLIYDLKLTWPPSWLQDPSRQPDTTAPIQGLDPQWLRGLLRPEFVAEDGGVRFPEPGDPQYRNFLAWADQSDNGLAARAGSLTRSVTDKIEDCIRELRD